MTTNDVKDLISQVFNPAQIDVSGEGSMYDVKIISDQFSDLSRVKRQQLVYSALNQAISSGEIHAVTMQTFTSQEWEAKKKLQVS